MKALYVTGACLTKNTSANMSHNAFLQGLIENGYQVDVVMANDSWGETDHTLPKFDKATYYEYNSVSLADKIRKKTRTIIRPVPQTENESAEKEAKATENSIKQRIRSLAKKLFYSIFKKNSIYVNESKWLRTACKYHKADDYDLVISNSSPAASHKLVQVLLEKKQISGKRWIQIWEDPWYYDLYGGFSEEVLGEELRLLQVASEVYYVSPLTLMYQKQYFSECAEKMKCIPLPFLDFSNKKRQGNTESDSFGYFGDYYSVTRNLKPFYKALVQSGYKGYIYGDSDLSLNDTKQIEVSGRVTLDVLSKIQEKTEVLVHLSNLKGGQIPGKIYHYSATTKPILFILDGTEEEKKALLEFFGKFDRYYFCDNTIKSILNAMKQIVHENLTFNPIDAFLPRNVVNQIINCK